MKLLLVLALLVLASLARLTADECPHDLEVKCIDDINKAYPPCKKAASEHGQDYPADIECMKYLQSVEKDCWPCICTVAKEQGWKVKGCN